MSGWQESIQVRIQSQSRDLSNGQEEDCATMCVVKAFHYLTLSSYTINFVTFIFISE